MTRKRRQGSWHTPPPPFNPEFRAGLGKAVSREYTKWCEENPNSTQEERKEAHRTIHENLRPQYPSNLASWNGGFWCAL